MQRSRSSVLLFTFLSLWLAPLAGARAQDVTYRTRSTISMGSGMDRVMNLAARLGGGSTETVETQYIKGRRLRTDVEGSSSIVDLERGRLLWFDHNARTYTEFTMDSLRAMSEAMARSMTAAGQTPAEPVAEPQPSDVVYTFDVSVDRTGERERIVGYDAERVLVTVTVDARERDAAPDEPGARFVVLSDIWSSESLPGREALATIGREQAEAVAAAAKPMGDALTSAMAGEPGQRAAFERAAEEMEKIEGTPVRTTTYMVVGTTDKPIDREAVLAPPAAQTESRGGGLRDAARGAVGGLLGRRRAPEPEPAPAEEPTQATLFKFIQEMIEVSTSPIPDSTFEVPSGYRPAGG